MTDIFNNTQGPVDNTGVDPGTPPESAPVVDSAPALELKPGYIVFYDAAVYGEADPVVHVGVVIHAADGRVHVHQLGLARDSADFPAADVRLNA